MKASPRIALILLALAGCRRAATDADCAEMLDRIVALELRERDFHDPVLEERKQRELRATLAPELAKCRGRRMRASTLPCVRAAKTTEEITHSCLR